MKAVTEYLDRRVEEASKKYLKQFIFPSYVGRAMVRMLYTTWLRNAEIRNIKMQDIDLDNMTGKVIGKGNKHCTFTFSEKARDMLKIYLDKRQQFYPDRKFMYLFSSIHNNPWVPITGEWLNGLLNEIGKKAGLTKRLHAHTFRHTCATHLLDAGANIREVQEKLRHVNLDTTALYTHISSNKLKEITNGLCL